MKKVMAQIKKEISSNLIGIDNCPFFSYDLAYRPTASCKSTYSVLGILSAHSVLQADDI